MASRVSILLLLALLMSTEGTQAADPVLERRAFKPVADGPELLYRILQPKAEPTEKLPLLLCLHGAGERGNDNDKQIGWFAPLFTGENVEKFRCVVVLPQVPTGKLWATYGWSTNSSEMPTAPSDSLRLTKLVVDDLIKSGTVDPDRIYVTGLSMGGYGTWEFAQRWPEFVAAAVPVCGGGDVTQAARLKRVPLWAFHGAKDTAVKVTESTKMIDAMKATGAEPKLTIYPEVGHDSWRGAYSDPELLPWLFAQRRAKTDAK